MLPKRVFYIVVILPTLQVLEQGVRLTHSLKRGSNTVSLTLQGACSRHTTESHLKPKGPLPFEIYPMPDL